MSRQNRIDPFSNIVAVPQKGTCMGNRGILHNEAGEIKHYHRHKAWIICKLTFKDRHRAVMRAGRYTELFFLDEATALAAGHRPCAECNRQKYNTFGQLWRQLYPGVTDKIDDVLHRERFVPYQKDWHQKKRTYTALLDTLPAGAFITLDSLPYLVVENGLQLWRFTGYGKIIPKPTNSVVTVLTPASTVQVLAQGYLPEVYDPPNVYGGFA